MTFPPNRTPDRDSDGDRSTDRPLTEFLQRHAATPPAADSSLRSQILTDIANHPHSSSMPVRVRQAIARGGKGWWLLPPVVATALVASWLLPRPVSLTADERLDLEGYLISSWSAATTIETDLLDDWLEDGDPDLVDEF